MTARPVGAHATKLAAALAGTRSGKSTREIAVDPYGADQMAADWHRDGWMRAQVRRLVRRAGLHLAPDRHDRRTRGARLLPPGTGGAAVRSPA